MTFHGVGMDFFLELHIVKGWRGVHLWRFNCIDFICFVNFFIEITKCHNKIDPGPCMGYFPRWFYNATGKNCKEFIYGGCKGNENNFGSKEECETQCLQVKQSESLTVLLSGNCIFLLLTLGDKRGGIAVRI